MQILAQTGRARGQPGSVPEELHVPTGWGSEQFEIFKVDGDDLVAVDRKQHNTRVNDIGGSRRTRRLLQREGPPHRARRPLERPTTKFS